MYKYVSSVGLGTPHTPEYQYWSLYFDPKSCSVLLSSAAPAPTTSIRMPRSAASRTTLPMLRATTSTPTRPAMASRSRRRATPTEHVVPWLTCRPRASTSRWHTPPTRRATIQWVTTCPPRPQFRLTFSVPWNISAPIPRRPPRRSSSNLE